MQSKYSNPSVSNSNLFAQASALSGFKFSTIGHNPSLLERMGDTPLVTPPSDRNPSQEQNSASHTPFRPSPSQPFLPLGAALVERGSSVKPVLSQDLSSVVPVPTLFAPPEPLNDVKSHQTLITIRPSVFPDLQYPNVTPGIDSPNWELSVAPMPMDQDASHPPRPSVMPPVSAAKAPVETGIADESTNNSALSLPSAPLQPRLSTTSTETEQVLRPVEQLLRLASVREERTSKHREVFDLRSGELSTFGAEASRSVRDFLEKFDSLKQQAEELRTQAEQMMHEANKTHDMADRVIVSAGTLAVDALVANNHVCRVVERSEQMTRYMRKFFDWLATLRGREQEKIALIQAEIVEQEQAELLRRQQELQQQLERRKIEEQEKMEAAKREEEEREAARQKAEEESEAARMRSYDLRRAEVMAEKRRATEAQAQSIQAERERRIADASGSSSGPSIRGSNAPLSTSPVPTPGLTHGAGVSTSVTSSQAAVPAPSRSPVARTGGAPDLSPSHSHSLPLAYNVKGVPAHVSFVPAQTEAGRAVNTDSPLSSTTLASELRPRNVVEISQHPRSNQVNHDLAQGQIRPWRAAPTLEPHRAEVKCEPLVEELPASHLRPLSGIVNTDQYQHSQPVASLRTASQDRNVEHQHAPASSTSGSRATSLHVAQTEDHRHPIDQSGRVPPQDDLRRPHNSPPDHVIPSTNERPYERPDSVSSDRSVSRWDYRDRRSPSPPSSGGARSRSKSLPRSPPYRRKRTRSASPPHYEVRQAVDHREPDRPRMRPRIDDRDRSRRYNGYDQARRGNSPQRHRALLPRRTVNSYRSSPPPSPRQYREGFPPRRRYPDWLLAAEHVPQRFDARGWKTEEYWTNTKTRRDEAAYIGVEAHRASEEEQPRWQQDQRQRRTPSPIERDQTSTPSPRQAEAEIGLLDRINMDEADDRERGRGRPLVARGGPITRRGTRGTFSSGRGRGTSGPTPPALLSRMSETTTRPPRAAPPLSLSDRMQQD